MPSNIEEKRLRRAGRNCSAASVTANSLHYTVPRPQLPMVTREEVLWCYRILLDREPESEAIIALHCTAKNRAALARSFMAGNEFMGRHSVPAVARVPLDVPALLIETKLAPHALTRLVDRIRNAWVRLGTAHAHWSVLTAPQYLPQNLESEIEGFWETGHEHARLAFSMLRRHGINQLADLRCVEYGCGVGRVTMALAEAFREVVAYDISAAHLEHAKSRSEVLGVSNIRFVECSGDLLLPMESCDVFYSVIVLQHNPPPVMHALIANALCALKPGGLALFQVPTYILGYNFNSQEYLAETGARDDMEMHCLPQHEIFELADLHRCTVLEVREDNWTGALDRFVSNSFVIRKKGS